MSPEFGTGSLGSAAPDVHVRFLVLPSDPEDTSLLFDDEFWSWWIQDRPNPFDGAPTTRWGLTRLPHADAAVRLDRTPRDGRAWESYLAALRNGGLEFGLSRSGSTGWRRDEEENEIQVFFLATIVGRIWVALSLYEELLERCAVGGPWEVSLGLRDSKGAVIGNVAAGWEGPMRSWPGDPLPRCPDPNVLIRRELMQWPDSKARRSLAFDIGANVEDAFGFEGRRFLSRVDPDIGTFDSSRYRPDS
jgi:hypothetical protein